MHVEPFATLTLPQELFDSLPEQVRAYIRYLESVIQQQQLAIQRLETKVHDLEARLAKNSSNSGKPPSSDGLKRKPKSQQQHSGKKPGGQEGHIGKGKQQVNNPDHIVTHSPNTCNGCKASLGAATGTCGEKRQVFEIPQPKIEVTEHRVEEKKWPCCGRMNRAEFPEDVKGPATIQIPPPFGRGV